MPGSDHGGQLPDGDRADDRTAGMDLGALVERVEAGLLGGERRYTREDVTQRSGLSEDELRSLWRALGFASVDDGQRVFTEADVEALRNVVRLREIGDIDDDVMQAMTRIIGQTFARLASWQGQLVVEILGRQPELLADESGDAVLALMDGLAPVVTDLHTYVWRRQLAAYLSRVASNAAGESGLSTDMAVGFVDMAGFTTLTRRSSEAELRGVLEAFETLATDVVGARRGQIVKTIGDEILYVADRARDGAEIALALLEAAADDDALPPLRAGVAFGPVVSRLGDVYGQTVNIASRLTSIAREGTVLADNVLSAELADDGSLALHPMRPTSVRGYRHLRPWRLRRAQE